MRRSKAVWWRGARRSAGHARGVCATPRGACADRGAGARGRQRREFSPGASFRVVVGGDSSRRALSAHHAAHRQRRPLRARGFRARCPPLPSCRPCPHVFGMPVARDRKFAPDPTANYTRRCWWPPSCAVWIPFTRWAAPRPSPLLRSVRPVFAKWTRSLDPAARGSRPPTSSAVPPAGPSEVLVIADESANAKFVAADLLAQAEHDVIAQVVLVTTSKALAVEIAAQAPRLSRRDIVSQSMTDSRSCGRVSLSQLPYTPEHLIIPGPVIPARCLRSMLECGLGIPRRVVTESMGDCSGTIHVLPTYGSSAQSQRDPCSTIKSGSQCQLSVGACVPCGPHGRDAVRHRKASTRMAMP